MTLRPESRRLVAVESPYKAADGFTVAENVTFARALLRWGTQRGYAPYAMHLLYTQDGILDDTVPEERMAGIECGLAWTRLAPEVWYCLRPGQAMSSGMQLAYDRDRARVADGEALIVRALTFQQQGTVIELVAGWDEAMTVAPARVPDTRARRARGVPCR